MKVTQVNLNLIESQRSPTLCAAASFVIDSEFVVKDVKVIRRKDGSYFVAMPSTYVNGEFKDICHPVTSQTRDKIETAILDEFNKAVECNSGKPKFGRKLLESNSPAVGAPLLGPRGDTGSKDKTGSVSSGALENSESDSANTKADEFEQLANNLVAAIKEGAEQGSQDLASSHQESKVSDSSRGLDASLLDKIL